MRHGLFHQVWAQSAVTDAACIAQAIDDVILADELGYTSCWFGEHHSNRHKPVFGRVPIPEILIARLIPQTRRIRLGTGVKILPGDSATRTAEAMTLLDLLAGGRVEFGLGMSMRADKLAAAHDRGSEFRSRLESVLSLLDMAPPVQDDRPPITPRPTRDFRPSIWVAAREFETIAHAASMGVHLVVGQLEEAAKQRAYIDAFRSSLPVSRAGAPQQEVRGVRMVHVAASDSEAWQSVEHVVRQMFAARGTTAYGRLAVAEGRLTLEDSDDPTEMMRQTGLIAGSPDTVHRQLADYIANTGIDQLDVMIHLPDIAAASVRRSMHLYAKEVVPRFAHRAPVLSA